MVTSLKQGQSIRVGGQWATVTYFIGDEHVVVTLDTDQQLQVSLAQVRTAWGNPTIVSQRNHCVSDVPDAVWRGAVSRVADGENMGAVLAWLVKQGYRLHQDLARGEINRRRGEGVYHTCPDCGVTILWNSKRCRRCSGARNGRSNGGARHFPELAL